MVRLAVAPLLLAGCVQAFELDDPVVDEETPDGSDSGSGSGAGSGSATCGSGASAHQTSGGICYERFNERLSWHLARDRCASRGGMLAKTESVDVRNVVVLMIVVGEALHLGATDESQPGIYRWLDGTPVLYPAWLPYQPDGEIGEHCLALLHAGAIGYADFPCQELQPFVCERPF